MTTNLNKVNKIIILCLFGIIALIFLGCKKNLSDVKSDLKKGLNIDIEIYDPSYSMSNFKYNYYKVEYFIRGCRKFEEVFRMSKGCTERKAKEDGGIGFYNSMEQTVELRETDIIRYLDVFKNCRFVPGAYAVFDTDRCTLRVFYSPKLN